MHTDLDALLDREGVGRQRQQQRLLFSEDLAHRAGAIFGARSVGGEAETPSEGLGIEIVDIVERAGGEEGITDKTDGPLYPAFISRQQLLLVLTANWFISRSHIPFTRSVGRDWSC